MLKEINMDKVDLNKIQSSLNKISLEEENQIKQKELDELKGDQIIFSWQLEKFKKDFFEPLYELNIKELNEFTDVKYSEIHFDLYCYHLIDSERIAFINALAESECEFLMDKKYKYLEDKYKVSLYDVCKEKYNISVSENEFNQNKFLYKTMLINDFFSKSLKQINSKIQKRVKILEEYGFDYRVVTDVNILNLGMKEHDAKVITKEEKINQFHFENSFISIYENDNDNSMVKYIASILNQILPKEHFLYSFNRRALTREIAHFFKYRYKKDLSVCIKADIKNNLPLFISNITDYIKYLKNSDLYIKYLATLYSFYCAGSQNALLTLKTRLKRFKENK